MHHATIKHRAHTGVHQRSHKSIPPGDTYRMSEFGRTETTGRCSCFPFFGERTGPGAATGSRCRSGRPSPRTSNGLTSRCLRCRVGMMSVKMGVSERVRERLWMQMWRRVWRRVCGWADTIFVYVGPSANAALVQSEHFAARAALVGHNLDRTINLREKEI